VFLLCFFIIGILQYIYYEKNLDEVCRTIVYVIPELFNCFVSFMFIIVGFQIQKSANEFELERRTSLKEVEQI
jgi:uncharacterized membrane protein YpjA